jgi:hypothetical protein
MGASLPHIILCRTGEDVRRCTACWGCEALFDASMDLTIGELMQAAARNDERALACRTLWSPALAASGIRCQQGIRVGAVIDALRAEAVLRGHAIPPAERTIA